MKFIKAPYVGPNWEELDEIAHKMNVLHNVLINRASLRESFYKEHEIPQWLKNLAAKLRFYISDHELCYKYRGDEYYPSVCIKFDSNWRDLCINLLEDSDIRSIPPEDIERFMLGYGDYLDWYFTTLDIGSILKTGIMLDQEGIDHIRYEINYRMDMIKHYSGLGEDIFERVLYILVGYERPSFDRLMCYFHVEFDHADEVPHERPKSRDETFDSEININSPPI